MSWKASAFVLDLARTHAWLSSTQLTVLYALGARHHQDYHCAFGSLKRIAADTHLHEVTVSTTISELDDKGILCVYEGQLPRRKSDPEDRRRTRGSMWCFVGLDPTEGPDVEDATRRTRVGGRPVAASVSPGLTEFEEGELAESEDELAGSNGSVSHRLPDELAGLNSPLIAGYRPDPTRSVGVAGEKPARAPDAAVPRRATESEPAEPTSLRPQQQQCPMCPEVFTNGEALREHLDTSPRHKVRPVAEDFKHGRPSSAKPIRASDEEARKQADQVAAELAVMAQRPRLAPTDLPPDLLAEHERFLARERAASSRASPAAADVHTPANGVSG